MSVSLNCDLCDLMIGVISRSLPCRIAYTPSTHCLNVYNLFRISVAKAAGQFARSTSVKSTPCTPAAKGFSILWCRACLYVDRVGQPLRVHRDVALDSGHLLARVIALVPGAVSVLHALGSTIQKLVLCRCFTRSIVFRGQSGKSAGSMRHWRRSENVVRFGPAPDRLAFRANCSRLMLLG